MMTDYEQGVRHALSAAARVLNDTADDFEQMAAQLEKEIRAAQAGSAQGPKIGVPGMMYRASGFREKVLLLRGQAGQIRDLKVTRGR